MSNKKKAFGANIKLFATIERNNYKMLYLHCLVWLKNISYLAILQSQIQSNIKFCQKLFLFLKHIIKCSTCKNFSSETLN